MITRTVAVMLTLVVAAHSSESSAAGKDPMRDGRVLGAGAVASFVCSGVFVSKRDFEDVLAEELTDVDGQPIRMIVFPWRPVVDMALKTVTMKTDDGLSPMIAAYRETLGCSLLPYGADVKEALPALPLLQAPRRSAPTHAEPSPWPTGDATPSDAPVPHYRDRLDEVVDAAFDAKTYNEQTRTLGVVIVHRGRIVAERYRKGFGVHTQYRTWSMGKSIANALVGIAVERGLLESAKQPVLVPEWGREDDPRRQITLDHLLHMASGLQTINPEDGSETYAAYFGGVDTAQAAASTDLAYEPGTRFHYSNYDTLLLMRSLKAAMRDDRAYLQFPYEALFDRIGMRDTIAETDFYGNFIISSQIYTTPRDMARFALLYLNDGVWNGERILPEDWVRESCAATPLREDGRYGAQWWIYDTKNSSLATKVCHAQGARGQIAAYVPSRDLVIVRTGLDSLQNWRWEFAQERFIKDVIEAIGTD